MRKVQSETQRQRALFLRQAVVTTEYIASHTLSVFSIQQLYTYNNMTTTPQSDCPKSYLYLYELRAINQYSLNRLTQKTYLQRYLLIRFSPGLSDPVLIGSHPEGPIFQQSPPSLRHEISRQPDPLSARIQLVDFQHLGQHIRPVLLRMDLC